MKTSVEQKTLYGMDVLQYTYRNQLFISLINYYLGTFLLKKQIQSLQTQEDSHSVRPVIALVQSIQGKLARFRGGGGAWHQGW